MRMGGGARGLSTFSKDHAKRSSGNGGGRPENPL